MRVLTKEIALEVAAEVSSVSEFIERLEKMKLIRPAPAMSLNKRQIVQILKQSDRVRSEVNSPYILKRLVEAGYLNREKDMQFVGIGRKPYLYTLTPKAKNLINLSVNWFKKTEEA